MPRVEHPPKGSKKVFRYNFRYKTQKAAIRAAK